MPRLTQFYKLTHSWATGWEDERQSQEIIFRTDKNDELLGTHEDVNKMPDYILDELGVCVDAQDQDVIEIEEYTMPDIVKEEPCPTK